MKCNFRPTNYVHPEKPHLRFHRCTRAKCGNGIFLSKKQRAAPVRCGHPALGLGDVVATTAKAIGFKETPGCGCERRRQLLNELVAIPRFGLPAFVAKALGRKVPAWPAGLSYQPTGLMRAVWSAWKGVSAIAFVARAGSR